MYFVLKQKRNGKRYAENWQPVSLYDSEDYLEDKQFLRQNKKRDLI
jgi:hypothetical protein